MKQGYFFNFCLDGIDDYDRKKPKCECTTDRWMINDTHIQNNYFSRKAKKYQLMVNIFSWVFNLGANSFDKIFSKKWKKIFCFLFFIIDDDFLPRDFYCSFFFLLLIVLSFFGMMMLLLMMLFNAPTWHTSSSTLWPALHTSPANNSIGNISKVHTWLVSVVVLGGGLLYLTKIQGSHISKPSSNYPIWVLAIYKMPMKQNVKWKMGLA